MSSCKTRTSAESRFPGFQEQPFTATVIYGYCNKQLIFIEPMVSLAFLQSTPTFSAPLARPSKARPAPILQATASDMTRPPSLTR